jgi:hypothetical protein
VSEGGYKLRYRPSGAVAKAFLQHRPEPVPEGEEADASWPIDVLVGPIGSGKSVASLIRLFMHACQQPAGSDGWRRSRWAVVRNTNPMLETTTIPSWLDWFPEDAFGQFNWSPPYSHTIKLDEAKVELVVWFIPLDRPEQVKKFLSMELTGVWFNEGREIPRELVIAGRSRCGRYPSRRSGADIDAGWAGVLMDTNAPEDELHYLSMWAGWVAPPEWMDAFTRRLMTKPKSVAIFEQPPGLFPILDDRGDVVGFNPNPAAENLANLRRGYYLAQLDGNTVDWLLNMCCVQMRKGTSTRPIHPQFRRAIHVARLPIDYDRDAGGSLLIGGDFARNPAYVLAQSVRGQVRVLREWIGTNISVQQFVRTTVLPELRAEYPDVDPSRLRGWGDPSGGARTGGDDTTAYSHMRTEGLAMVPCWTNDPDERQAAVDRRLTSMVDGAPAFLVSPRCTTLIGGLAGGYQLRRLKVEGTIDTFTEGAVKNLYSHVCDALQYLLAGLDRGNARTVGEQKRAARDTSQPNGRVRVDSFALARRRKGAA